MMTEILKYIFTAKKQRYNFLAKARHWKTYRQKFKIVDQFGKVYMSGMVDHNLALEIATAWTDQSYIE